LAQVREEERWGGGLSQGGREGLRRRARGAREEKRRRSRVGTTKKWVGKWRRRADAREGGRTGGEGGRESASHKVRTSFCVHFILFRSRDSTSRPGPREQACYPRGTWQSTTVLLPCTACLLEKKNSSTPPDQVKAKHTKGNQPHKAARVTPLTSALVRAYGKWARRTAVAGKRSVTPFVPSYIRLVGGLIRKNANLLP
jgi:hypothetical protein